MDLPIDARDAPSRLKYVYETKLFALWFVFGSSADGTVDLSDGQDDVFVGVTQAQADALIDARDRFCNAVIEVLNKETE